jgi:hypothetical protein
MEAEITDAPTFSSNMDLENLLKPGTIILDCGDQTKLSFGGEV